MTRIDKLYEQLRKKDEVPGTDEKGVLQKLGVRDYSESELKRFIKKAKNPETKAKWQAELAKLNKKKHKKVRENVQRRVKDEKKKGTFFSRDDRRKLQILEEKMKGAKGNEAKKIGTQIATLREKKSRVENKTRAEKKNRKLAQRNIEANKAREQKRQEKIKKIKARNKKITKREKTITDIDDAIEKIESIPDSVMSAGEKQQRINQLKNKKNQHARNVEDLALEKDPATLENKRQAENNKKLVEANAQIKQTKIKIKEGEAKVDKEKEEFKTKFGIDMPDDVVEALEENIGLTALRNDLETAIENRDAADINVQRDRQRDKQREDQLQRNAVNEQLQAKLKIERDKKQKVLDAINDPDKLMKIAKEKKLEQQRENFRAEAQPIIEEYDTVIDELQDEINELVTEGDFNPEELEDLASQMSVLSSEKKKIENHIKNDKFDPLSHKIENAQLKPVEPEKPVNEYRNRLRVTAEQRKRQQLQSRTSPNPATTNQDSDTGTQDDNLSLRDRAKAQKEEGKNTKVFGGSTSVPLMANQIINDPNSKFEVPASKKNALLLQLASQGEDGLTLVEEGVIKFKSTPTIDFVNKMGSQLADLKMASTLVDMEFAMKDIEDFNIEMGVTTKEETAIDKLLKSTQAFYHKG